MIITAISSLTNDVRVSIRIDDPEGLPTEFYTTHVSLYVGEEGYTVTSKPTEETAHSIECDTLEEAIRMFAMLETFAQSVRSAISSILSL